MPTQIKTLRFAARADQETLAAFWGEAQKAHRHFNDLITAELEIRAQYPLIDRNSTRRQQLGQRKKQLVAIKKTKQATDNQRAGQKVKLPKGWLTRYKVAIAKIEHLISTLPKDPELERVLAELTALKETRGKGRIKDAAQEEHDARMLECARQHPLALNRVMRDIERRRKERELRASSGSHCSTYALTEAAVNQALKIPHPRRRTWRLRDQHRVGIGFVANNGTAIPWEKLIRSRQSGWANCEIDVRFGERGSPVYTVQFKNHREWAKELHRIPVGAEIRTAWLQLVRRRHDHWDLELCLTISMPISGIKEEGPALGIDAGYRAVGEDRERLRVASLSTGQHVETPARYRSMVAQAQSLRGIADRMTLEYWAHHHGAIPQHAGRPWTARRLHRVIMGGAYVSQARLSAREASRLWKAGDRSFEAYRLQWKHLQQWACALDERARRIRQEHYRVTAAQLAQEYAVVVEEALRLDNMARSRIAGGNRAEAAPSEFRAAVKSACQTYGAKHIQVPAPGTSLECSVCHVQGTREGETFTCPRGHALHADTNAARNILSRGISSAQAVSIPQEPLEKSNYPKNNQQLVRLENPESDQISPM